MSPIESAYSSESLFFGLASTAGRRGSLTVPRPSAGRDTSSSKDRTVWCESGREEETAPRRWLRCSCSIMPTNPAEIELKQYLSTFIPTPTTTDGDASAEDTPHTWRSQRSKCCGNSQSLYCKHCFRLLAPEEMLPQSVIDRRILLSGNEDSESDPAPARRPLRLPFDLEIVLDDRKGSATGLHAVSLLTTRESSLGLGKVSLLDFSETQEIFPDAYSDVGNGSTYLLFPSVDSVPLQSVANDIETLVVLDCRWTKSRLIRKNEAFKQMKKVHLTHGPSESFFWRWHNQGRGMCSTIEAIYYAAHEMMMTGRWEAVDKNNLKHLLWLFGHQRARIREKLPKGTDAPDSVEGKEWQRGLKKQKGTSRQLRHKADAQRLEEKKRQKEERLKASRKSNTTLS